MPHPQTTPATHMAHLMSATEELFRLPATLYIECGMQCSTDGCRNARLALRMTLSISRCPVPSTQIVIMACSLELRLFSGSDRFQPASCGDAPAAARRRRRIRSFPNAEARPCTVAFASSTKEATR